jgi:microcystin-dependent protein
LLYANITTTIGNNGSGAAHDILQPSRVVNFIIRIA